jgi:hypothetical protein
VSPRSRVAAAALASTIAVMYYAVEELAPLIGAASLPDRVGAGAVGVLASGTLYQALNGAATWVILKVSRLKRLFFGAHYLEDTWVGFYEERDTERCLLIEHFEQDFDGITVRGESYDENGHPRAQWVSESVSFDERKGTLGYHYICHVLTDKKVEQGLTAFEIVRDGPTAPAQKLKGYSTDLHDGNRSPAWEKRLAGRSINLETALREARSYRDEVLTARLSARTPPTVARV